MFPSCSDQVMASPTISCFLCHRCGGDKIIPFTIQTLKKACVILESRKLNDLKYKDVILPTDVSDVEGYHPRCYKNFTALMSKFYDKIEQLTITSDVQSTSAAVASTSKKTISSLSKENRPSSSSSYPSHSVDTVCFFCNKRTKKYRGNMETLHKGSKISFKPIIEAYSTALNDIDIKKKFENITNEILYHNKCKNECLNKGKQPVQSSTDTAWHRYRKYHKVAYTEVSEFIKENIIEKKECYFLSFLLDYYMDALCRIAEDNSDSYDNTFTEQHLEWKIEKTFEYEIKIICADKKKIVTPIRRRIIDDVAISLLEESEILQKAAFILRGKIFNITSNKLSSNLTTEHLLEGECSIPERINDFYVSLIGGSRRSIRESSYCERTVKSLSHDLISAVSNGRIKTSKQISLGMSLKSLTNSRKVVDIVNRYGHCCSYNVLEELETKAIFYPTSRSNICPSGIEMSPNLFTGVAFDNFDRFFDTTIEKDTLHHTVGIIYQNVDPNDDVGMPDIPDIEVQVASTSKRRRTLDPIAPELFLYPKKQKSVKILRPVEDELSRQLLAINVESISQLDTIWMLSHALKVPNTPMWVGFNSQIVEDKNPKQKVSYFTPMNFLPTNTSVVIETMKQSMKIATELKQTYMPVTYDSKNAKIAFQIQTAEKPTYNNLFIHLGAFHIMLAYFETIGKCIDECGLLNILIESDLLAPGSVNGFIKGKYYNRCKRLHSLMALALEILHFEAFVEREKFNIAFSLHIELAEFKNKKLSTPVTENHALFELIKKYTAHKEATMNGEFGNTAKFYMMYINLVNYYLTLSRSIRMGDFSIFKYILPKIANLFFILNQQNYACSLVKYHDNLLKVSLTHPGLEKIFEKGYFGVKRSEKSFSKQPIDITLEQTMNNDAARRLTGFINFTNSISARERWSKSHDIRSNILSHVYEEICLKKSQDISADLESYQMKRNSNHLQNLIETIKKYTNPFNPDLDDECLFNIYTGKAATKPVQNFLLNIEKSGNELRETFIAECDSDDSRFVKPITRIKILNFATEGVKKEIKIGDEVQEVCMQRDLFGRMLAILLENNIDVARVLPYPITPIPLSFCNLDGSVYKTEKSLIFKILEKIVDTQAPNNFDVAIYDGCFILNSMKDIPTTFAKLSEKFLQMVTESSASRIDVVFDRYSSPSIKDHGRMQQRHGQNLDYNISSPDQQRPTNFTKELKNNNKFKEALVEFFIMHWGTDDVAPFIGNKLISLNYEKCHTFKIVNETVVTGVDEILSCEDHEETDTKIVHHVCNIDYDANVLIRCSDTDILVIMLGNMEHLFSDTIRVWMEIGVEKNRRLLDVTELYNNLGPSLSRSIPGFHATTGCDYNPGFNRKGKQRLFELLQNSVEYQVAFSTLGNSDLFDLEGAVFDVFGKFVCEIYDVPRLDDVNEARFQIFSKTCKAKNVNESFRNNLKNYDATNLPPCKTELMQQLLRAHYIATIWRNADLKDPTCGLHAQEYGWTEIDNKYDFIWSEGDHLPMFISDVIACDITGIENYADDEEIKEDSEEDEPESYWDID